jgi:DNA-binding NtrC family response regulator
MGELSDKLILFLDDEKTNGELVSELLSSEGLSVKSFSEGRKAIDYYTENYEAVSLIIMDMVMPELNGIACLKAFKKINPECRVIISSGYMDEDMGDKISIYKIDGFISKPYEVETFVETVHSIISSS